MCVCFVCEAQNFLIVLSIVHCKCNVYIIVEQNKCQYRDTIITVG